MSITLLGWVLAVAATVTAAPQAWRILRHRRSSGVSLTTCSLGVGTMTAWCWFTASIGDLPALGSSLGPLICWSGCVYGLYRTGTGRRALGVTALVVVSVLLACAAGLAPTVAVAGSLSWALPQVLSVLRGGDLSGVSTLAYLFISVENAGWVAYAFGTSTWEYAIAPLVQGPAALIIALRALHDTRTRSDEVQQPCSLVSEAGR